MGAGAYAHRPIGEVSGGEQQRLLIAQALVRKPEAIEWEEPAEPVPTAAPASTMSDVNSDFSHKFGLNMRQAKFMRELKIGEFKSVHDYKDRFDISELTACRDLSNLIRAGLVVRVGRARATRYTTR